MALPESREFHHKDTEDTKIWNSREKAQKAQKRKTKNLTLSRKDAEERLELDWP